MSTSSYQVKRLHNQPLVSDGHNTNGPSVIKVPHWLGVNQRPFTIKNGKKIVAKYYLYYANHNGKFIHMAWSHKIDSGYWFKFNRPDLGLNVVEVPGRGVLDLVNGPQRIYLNSSRSIYLGKPDGKPGHIASPDVHVDHQKKRIIMYFHGNGSGTAFRRNSKGQRIPYPAKQNTYVATSVDGLNFNLPDLGGQAGHGILPICIGRAYMRVFSYRGQTYGFSRSALINISPHDPLALPDPEFPTDSTWTAIGIQEQTELSQYFREYYLPEINHYRSELNQPSFKQFDLEGQVFPRHLCVRRLPDERHLEVFFSVKFKKGGNFEQWRPPNDSERILRVVYDLSCEPWQIQSDANGQMRIEEILKAETYWELKGLCDPFVFIDTDKRIYLFYSGGPIQSEGAIGMVELSPK